MTADRSEWPHPLVEVRNRENGKMDEVVVYREHAEGKKRCVFHLEYMDDNHVWMAVELPDGRRVTVALYTGSRAKIAAHVEVE